MKKLLFLFVIITANLLLFAQNQNSWKKVTKEDFAVTYQQNQVPAIVISENVKYYFDVYNEELRLYYTVTKKIKILDTAGFKYANFTLKFQSKDNIENIISLKGIDYKMKNGKIKAVKLKNKDVERVKVNDYYEERRVEFPELEPGDVVVYQYSVATLKMINPPQWYFQKEIPTLSSTAEVDLPDFISYQIKIIGNQYGLQQRQEESSMNLNYIVHYKDPIVYQGGHRAGYEGPYDFYFQTINHVFEMKDIPPLHDEDMVDCSCNYRSSLLLDLYRVDRNTYLTNNLDIFFWSLLTKPLYLITLYNTRYYNEIENENIGVSVPAGFILYNAGDWKNTDNGLLKSKDFYQAIIKDWNYQSYMSLILGDDGNADDFTKMKKIYDYIREKVVWNGQLGIFASQYPEKTMVKKNGNAADINFLLISLLQKAGLEAYPVLIKTVEKGHVDQDLATYRQFNLVIASVFIDGKIYLLDARQREIPWNILPRRDLNGIGRLISPKGCRFIDIKPNKISYEMINTVIKLTDGKAECELSGKVSGYPVLDYINGKDTGDVKILNRKFTSTDIVDGNKIYPFDIYNIKNRFMAPTRTMPVYLAYPTIKKYTIWFNIPEGKTVKSAPQSFTASYNGLAASANVSQSGSALVITLVIKRTKTYYEANEYPNLRKVWLQIQNFLDTPIVLE